MFKTGISGNTAGKPKGSKNKVGETLRGHINNFLADNYKDFTKDFKAMPIEDRVKTYVSLLKYAVPTLSSAAIEFDYSKLTEKQCDFILEKIQNGYTPSLDELKSFENAE